MYGNCLLKNKENFSKNGYLKLKKFDYITYPISFHFQPVEKVCIDKKDYFVKSDDKVVTDTEVLLSQVYTRAGLKSAIYLPALDKQNHRTIISNDVSNSHTVYGGYFLFKMGKNSDGFAPDIIPFYKEDRYCYQDFITKSAMRDYLKMRLFDTASYNGDRHGDNFLFELENEIATRLFMYDHGASGRAVNSSNINLNDLTFINRLGDKYEKDREEMLMQFKENENVLEYVSPTALAENIGGINVVETASDIKSTIGYEVNQKYVDTIAKSYETMAEELIK